MNARDPIEILLVDDREDGLLALQAVLDNKDYRLVTATSGRQALSLLDDHEFAMILLDVQMPGLDGFQTASLIRKKVACEHVPIIFVTAINKDDSYVIQGYDAGAVDYLFKPFDPQVLKAKVAVFADLHRKTKQIQEHADLIARINERERIHDRTRLEVESLRRYQNLANAIPQILWKTGPTGELIYCNTGWREYTGFDVEKNAGISWRDAFEADDLKNFLKVWLESMTSGASFDMECRIVRHDNEVRWHWIKTVSERSETGEVMGWIGTCTDIHDRKLFEQNAIEARQLAESASLAKTHFLANMSHEIRTPLSAILGFSELLLDAEQSLNEKISCVATIRNNGKQLLKIIDEVLDISKIEAGRMEIEDLDIDVKEFFREIFVSMNLKAIEKGLILSLRPVGPLPRRVTTDPVRFRQIIVNIISNAIKFTQTGSIQMLVEWKEASAKVPAMLSVEIIDTGLGIDAMQVGKLFTPFVQADSSTTRRFGGTGLGLALSRKLAIALGGNVWLDRSTSAGSAFKIEIAPPLHNKSTFVSSFTDEQSEAQATDRSNHSGLEGVRVLLVEDVFENQLLISRFLNVAGANVDLAANGLEAVSMAQSNDYDVILMDIQMPELDGYGATSRLRNDGYKGAIIALTAHALQEERARCLQVGCDDHLTKPIDRGTLIQSVAEYARRASRLAPVLTVVS
ncbi:MAG: response regulator [Bdellovibrionota bacterium]